MMSSAENKKPLKRLVNMEDPPAKVMVGGEIIPKQPQKSTKAADDWRNHLCFS
jgi:hypothetical protein